MAQFVPSLPPSLPPSLSLSLSLSLSHTHTHTRTHTYTHARVLQSEYGDIYKVTLEAQQETVSAVKVRWQ